MSTDRPVPVRRVVRSVVVIVVFVLLGGAAGLLYTKLQHKVYTATTRIQVSPVTVDSGSQTNGRTTTTINMDTEAQVVTSAAVLQRAVQAYPTLRAQTFESLVSHTAITVPANSVVLNIAFSADTPGVAQAGANAIGTAYLDNRAAVATSQLNTLVKDTEANQNSRAAQIDKLTAKEATYPPNSPQRRQLQSQITQLTNEVRGYGNLLVTLGATQISPGATLTAASLPTSPSSPSKIVGLASGLGLGLLVGLLVAWLLNRLRRYVRRPEDITQIVDLTTIAVLPNLDKGGALSEPYRRVALITTSAVRNADRILFTTPAASPSGSRVATGVAAALLRAGTPVGLLRVNAHAVGGPRPRGLDLISVPNTDAVTRRHGESLDIALDRVRGRRELLVVDAVGATLSADAQAVAAIADAVVLVVDTGTRTKLVRAAVRALDDVGAPLLGVVLVRGGLRPPKVGRGRDADADYDVLDPPTAWRMAERHYPPSYELEPKQAADRPLVLEPPTVDPDPSVVAMMGGETPSRVEDPAERAPRRAGIVDAELADDGAPHDAHAEQGAADNGAAEDAAAEDAAADNGPAEDATVAEDGAGPVAVPAATDAAVDDGSADNGSADDGAADDGTADGTGAVPVAVPAAADAAVEPARSGSNGAGTDTPGAHRQTRQRIRSRGTGATRADVAQEVGSRTSSR